MQTFEYNPDNLPSADADRWAPVLNGEVFCSPACGSKCKLVDYERAMQAAEALSSLLGGGWHPNVYENGGWYYEVTKGSATVRRDGNGDYIAAIEVDYISKNHVLSICKENPDPRQAVEDLVLNLSEIISRLSRTKASVTLDLLSIEE